MMRENVSLAPLTTFGIGGEARYFAEASTIDELKDALLFARGRSLPVFVLGGGSNVIVSDTGFDGVVVRCNFDRIEEKKSVDEVVVTAGAGVPWDELVAHCASKGYWGIENLSLIPGTVGAAPVQNIGAYGCEVKDYVVEVRGMHFDGREQVLSNADCRFAYRDSAFKHEGFQAFAITHVSFRLSLVPKPNLSYKDLAQWFAGKSSPSLDEIRAAVISIRTGKFPDLAEIGTAGSFWKNPVIDRVHFDRLAAEYPGMPSFPAPAGQVKVPLAWVLDHICGLKGYTDGRVGLFKNQPLVLVAEKGATAAEVAAFASEIEAQVREKTGIEIEREVNGVSC